MSLDYLINKKIDDNDKFSEIEIKQIFTDLSEGLQYLHYFKVFHFDIKPANILLSQNDDFMLADFGQSMVFLSGLNSRSVLATPNYYSYQMKEAVDGKLIWKDVDSGKSDVFALGLVFLQVLKKLSSEIFVEKYTPLKLNEQPWFAPYFETIDLPKHKELVYEML